MERLSIFEILKFYKRFVSNHPLLSIVSLIGVTAIYILMFEKLDPGSSLFELFASKPALSISIAETERYSIDSNYIIIKRINVENTSRPLRNVKISIRISEQVEEIKFKSEPNISFRSTNFKDKLGNELIEIVCDSFEKNQTAEIRLVMIEKSIRPEKSSVVVEAVGAYGKDKFTGTSATSTLLPEAIDEKDITPNKRLHEDRS
jgi:hypothetical protein